MNLPLLLASLVLPVRAPASPAASGVASTASPDGVLSLLGNPAGLGTLEGWEANLETGGDRPAARHDLLLGRDGLAAGLVGQPGERGHGDQRALVAGYGLSPWDNLYAGARAVRRSTDGTSGDWSLDAGLLWRPSSYVSLGWDARGVAVRDDGRWQGHGLGLSVRPFGTPAVEVGGQLWLPSGPWKESAWDDPWEEASLSFLPLSWLRTRLGISSGGRVALDLAAWFSPRGEVHARLAPGDLGALQAIGLRLSSRSRAASLGEPGRVVIYRIPGSLSESDEEGAFSDVPGLEKVREDFRVLASDASVEGVVLDLGRRRFSPSQAAQVRRLVLELREAGKPVRAWAQDLDMANLQILSAADRCAASPLGIARTRGLSLQSLYFRRALDRFGVRVQVVRTGPWKSAMEPFLSDRMSPEVRENLGLLLSDLDSMMLGAVAASRGLDAAAFLGYVDTGSSLPTSARQAGLVDTLLEPDELASWFAGRKASVFRPDGFVREAWSSRPGVAVVVLDGAIVDDGDGGDALMAGRRVLRAGPVAAALRSLGDDPQVRAVVLRVNSPGGSVVASERIRRAVEALAKRKPVVASFAGTAASGAYLFSLPVRRMWSEPEALVGSIGVFAAKVSFEGLLDSLGVRVETLRTAPHAGEASVWSPLDSLQARRLDELVHEAWRQFSERTMASRSLDSAAFARVDGGRVFSGVRARDLGLVDSLGGLDAAVADARSLAGLPGDAPVVRREQPTSAPDGLLGRLGALGSAPVDPLAALRRRLEAVSVAEPELWALLPAEPVWR